MTLKVLGHVTLYEDQRFHAAFPSIVRRPDDSLVLAFRRARDGHWLVPPEKRGNQDPMARVDHLDSRSHIALMSLDAGGMNPVAPLDMLPMDPEAADQDPSLLVLPDDSLLLLSFSYYPLTSELEGVIEARAGSAHGRGCQYLLWGCHASLRNAATQAWAFHHRYLQSGDDYGRWFGAEPRQPVVGAIRGQLLHHEQALLAAVYWGAGDGCALFRSTDNGRSWVFQALIAIDPERHVTYQEPALCPAPDGGLVAFMRTAGAGGRLATAYSSDGQRWRSTRLHRLIGHPFHPLSLADGRVLLSYGFRKRPFGIRVRLLQTATADPDDSAEVIIRDDGHCADIGYPWAVQLADGDVLLVYYWTDARGRRTIVGTRLRL